MKNTQLQNFLQDPYGFSQTNTAVQAKLWKRGLELVQNKPKYPFLDAQREAWEEIAPMRVALMLGPPGTGKTYMVSWMILGYIAACIEHNRDNPDNPVTARILVSAFTKTAIVNVLDNIVTKLSYFPELPSLNITFQEEESRLPTDVVYQPTTYKQKKHTFQYCTENITIVGATVWTCLKAFEQNWIPKTGEYTSEIFDFLCIDEASQLRLSNALIPMAHLKESGRILFVGDNRQLPPIGETYIWANQNQEMGSSVYDFVYDAFLQHNQKEIRLKDTFRLNPMLAFLPSQYFYDNQYFSKVEKTEWMLDVKSTWTDQSEWIREVLNPNHAIVVLLMDSPAGGKQNPTEVELTKIIVNSLHQYMDFSDESKFWTENLAIISPHRLQNVAIRKALYPNFGNTVWSDTVEKMQGQERNAIIISMTVSDREFAMREEAFLFDPRRFNVAVTRAKNKVILLLNRVLFRALSNDEEVNKGLTFLMEFVFQCTMTWSGYIQGNKTEVLVREISAPPKTTTVLELIDQVLDYVHQEENEWVSVTMIEAKLSCTISLNTILQWQKSNHIDIMYHTDTNALCIRIRKQSSYPLPIEMVEETRNEMYKQVCTNNKALLLDFQNQYLWLSHDKENLLDVYLRRWVEAKEIVLFEENGYTYIRCITLSLQKSETPMTIDDIEQCLQRHVVELISAHGPMSTNELVSFVQKHNLINCTDYWKILPLLRNALFAPTSGCVFTANYVWDLQSNCK